MKKYVVTVEGENICFKQGSGRRSGLFTTRWVEAQEMDEAERLAIDLVREELASTHGVCNALDDPPAFSVDEIYEVESFDGYIAPGKGFSIFDM